MPVAWYTHIALVSIVLEVTNVSSVTPAEKQKKNLAFCVAAKCVFFLRESDEPPEIV